MLRAALLLCTAAVAVVVAQAGGPADAQSIAALRGGRALRAQQYTAVHVSCRRAAGRALCRWRAMRGPEQCTGTLAVRHRAVHGRWVKLGRSVRCTTEPTTQPLLGFNTAAAPGNVALQTRTGAVVRRMNIGWFQVEPAPGVFSWNDADRQYRTIVAGGLKPLVMLYLAPCWARPKTHCGALTSGPPDPAYDGAWADFVRRAVQRFPAAIGIEIWNEENLDSMWAPKANPARFAQVLKVAYEAVKAVSPTMPVISGGLLESTGQGHGPVSTGDATFLTEALEAGAGQYLDGIGFHAYPSTFDSSGARHWDPAALEASLQRVRAARDAAGGKQPIWLTELGESTTTQPGFPAAVSPAQQATDEMAMLDAATAARDVPVVIIHTLVDASPSPSDPIASALATATHVNISFNQINSGFGVFDSHQRPKPAACAISARLGGALRC